MKMSQIKEFSATESALSSLEEKYSFIPHAIINFDNQLLLLIEHTDTEIQAT